MQQTQLGHHVDAIEELPEDLKQEPIPLWETDIHRVAPRPETREVLEEHYQLEHGPVDELRIEESPIFDEGNTLETRFECSECRHDITEVYLHEQTERKSDRKTWGRHSNYICNCKESEFHGQDIQELHRYISANCDAVSASRCAWCGAKFFAVYKHVATKTRG